jgi:hypothetical protein
LECPKPAYVSLSERAEREIITNFDVVGIKEGERVDENAFKTTDIYILFFRKGDANYQLRRSGSLHGRRWKINIKSAGFIRHWIGFSVWMS